MTRVLTTDDVALLTTTEAARLACVQPRTVRAWIERGHLEPVVIDGKRFVTEADVLDCERARRRSGRRPHASGGGS
ncbi:helix-turn-helix domain-containing protein [Janibacter massiliensis]|uniref:helix-turn-helix domain-containing protein n=1 Tax=Janibacter massiliensis TaxID=2058291 RepID=UPI000D0F1F56|nr:helix-turn-helix domain-containing protein [Janibacter massiliensis]